jgi:putative restriction endonuclease
MKVGLLRGGRENMKSDRVFGAIEGVSVGAVFPTRKSLHDAGVHKPLQAGISGSGSEGADSIVVSGGYVDDIDDGDEIVYTGHGGQDRKGLHVHDQKFTRANRALAVSMQEGLPVRVVRGAKTDSAYAPKSGYRYDGLYRVAEYWQEPGRHTRRVYRYRLLRQDAEGSPWSHVASAVSDGVGNGQPPGRRNTFVSRIVRDTNVTRSVKALHDHRCQVCDLRLETDAGPYAEAAHIKPLGRPHDGPDTLSNVLCLCPNHHVLFDGGAFSIASDYQFVGQPQTSRGLLRRVASHQITSAHLAHHRRRFGFE